MATVVDEVIVRFLGQTGNVDAAISRVSRGLNGLGRVAVVTGGAMTGFFAGIGGASVLAAAQLEQTAVAFRVLTGDMQVAIDLMHDMEQFSARTPFELAGVEAAAKKLLAMGFTAEQIIPTLHDVGNVTAGIGIEGGRFDRIIHNLAQVGTQGHLTSREFRDFAVNGVPLMEALRATMSGLPADAGAATAAIDEMIQRGEVSFADVRRAFRWMATEGRFKDLMGEQAETLLGMLSNIRDKATIILRDIGKTFVEPIKSILRPILAAMDAFAAMSDTIKRTVGYVLIFGSMIGGIITSLGLAAMLAAGFVVIIGPAVAALTALMAVLSPLIVPLGVLAGLLATFAMAGLAAQGYEASFAGLKQFVLDMIPTFKLWASNVIGFFVNIKENWKVMTQFLKDNWVNIIFFIPKLLIDAVMMAFEMIVINTKLLVNTMFKLFGVFWTSMAKIVTPILNFIFSGEMIRIIWEGLKKAFKLFTEFFKRLWEGAKTGNFDLGDAFAEGMDLRDKKGLLGALNQIRKDFFEELQLAGSNFEYFDTSALSNLILEWEDLTEAADDWDVTFDDITDNAISNIQELRSELWELQQMFANRDDFDITQEGLVFGWAKVKEAIEETTKEQTEYEKAKKNEPELKSFGGASGASSASSAGGANGGNTAAASAALGASAANQFVNNQLPQMGFSRVTPKPEGMDPESYVYGEMREAFKDADWMQFQTDAANQELMNQYRQNLGGEEIQREVSEQFEEFHRQQQRARMEAIEAMNQAGVDGTEEVLTQSRNLIGQSSTSLDADGLPPLAGSFVPPNRRDDRDYFDTNSSGELVTSSPSTDSRLDTMIDLMNTQNHTRELRTLGEGGDDFPL